MSNPREVKVREPRREGESDGGRCSQAITASPEQLLRFLRMLPERLYEMTKSQNSLVGWERELCFRWYPAMSYLLGVEVSLGGLTPYVFGFITQSPLWLLGNWPMWLRDIWGLLGSWEQHCPACFQKKVPGKDWHDSLRPSLFTSRSLRPQE